LIALLSRASGYLIRLERWALVFLAAAVTGLILLNVVTRSVDYAIYWVDELAIYAMIWLVMIGASTKIRARKGIAVTLLQPMVGERIWHVFLLLVDIVVLAFALGLIGLAWIWYDPVTFAGFGFDPAAFAAQTFNFVYQEPTTTLGLPKYLIWLIMPITALSMSLHATANLCERVAGVPAPTFDLD